MSFVNENNSADCPIAASRRVTSDVTAKIYKIDRMDCRSLFTSHYTRDGKKTLCGLALDVTQDYSENGFCRRCEKIFDRLSETQPELRLVNRKEVNNMKKHNASHFDHGLSDAQITFVMNRFANRDAFFIETIELPEYLGTVPCGLHGPLVGGAPVEENEVTYAKRGTRAWNSRLVERPLQQVRTVTVIAGPHEETCPRCNGEGQIGDWKAAIPCSCERGKIKHACIVYTMYGGPLAPQEPDDPGCKDVPASRTFWSVHALSRT